MNKIFIIFIYPRFKKMWDELQNALDTVDFEKTKEIIEKNPTKINQEICINIGFNTLQYICGGNYLNCLFITGEDEVYFKFTFKLSEKYRIIKFLLEFGADVNMKEKNFENTSLGLFCKYFNKYMYKTFYHNCDDDCDDNCEKMIMILELLLDFGADPNIYSDDMTPLHYLLDNNGNIFEEDCKYHKSLIKAVKILIKKGANINLKGSMGKLVIDPFFVVLSFRNVSNEDNREIILEIIKIMLENGLNIEEIESKYSPLKLLFTHHLENKIKKLEKENEELRYKPGNPGYCEAMKDFEVLKGKKNE